MALRKSFCFLMFFVTLICCTHARTFEVGGKDGWTTHPSENYNSWASRLRFLINDTLHFKYDGGVDSVLVVNKGDYDGCNINNPIMKLDDGDSTFKFDRSGHFYSISGNKSNCDQGEKLIVEVLALSNQSSGTGGAATGGAATGGAATGGVAMCILGGGEATISSGSGANGTVKADKKSLAGGNAASPSAATGPLLGTGGNATGGSTTGGVAGGGVVICTLSGVVVNDRNGSRASGSGGAVRQSLGGGNPASFVTMIFGLWLLN